MDIDKIIDNLSIKYGLEPADIKTRYYRYKESALFYEGDSMKYLEAACQDLLLLKMFNDNSSNQIKENNKKRMR